MINMCAVSSVGMKYVSILGHHDSRIHVLKVGATCIEVYIVGKGILNQAGHSVWGLQNIFLVLNDYNDKQNLT